MRFIPRPRLWKYYAMLCVIHTVGRMPIGWRYGVARVVSDASYALRPTVRASLRSNARHVLGPDATKEEVEQVARACARNTGRYYADVIGMHRMDVREFFENDLLLEGVEYIREAQARGQGVVMASGHYANPEFAVQGLAAAGITVFALVEPLRPPELGNLMWNLRRVHGHMYEPVGFSTVKKALAWLRGGGVVCILIDRDIQKRGVMLDFFGHPARFPTGAADLALRTNAMLLPGFVRREEGYRVHAKIGPPLELVRTGNSEEDLRINTANLLAKFEEHVKRDPGQWSVIDRIWPDDLPEAPPETPTSTEPAEPKERQTVQ